MNEPRNTFHKYERLTLKRDIDRLFSAGSRSFAAYPLRAVCRLSDGGERVKVLVSVSKRHFRHAVDRNRAKRQIREAYRLNKGVLVRALEQYNSANDDTPKGLHIAFVWLADAPQPSEIVAKKVNNLLQRISERMLKVQDDSEGKTEGRQ